MNFTPFSSSSSKINYWTCLLTFNAKHGTTLLKLTHFFNPILYFPPLGSTTIVSTPSPPSTSLFSSSDSTPHSTSLFGMKNQFWLASVSDRSSIFLVTKPDPSPPCYESPAAVEKVTRREVKVVTSGFLDCAPPPFRNKVVSKYPHVLCLLCSLGFSFLFMWLHFRFWFFFIRLTLHLHFLFSWNSQPLVVHQWIQVQKEATLIYLNTFEWTCEELDIISQNILSMDLNINETNECTTSCFGSIQMLFSLVQTQFLIAPDLNFPNQTSNNGGGSDKIQYQIAAMNP